jgi:hypothetical protein
MDRYSSGDYLEENPTWHAEDSAWKAGEILRMIERNHLTPSSVCEVGCGAGEILLELHKRLPDHVRFSGYEVSPQAYALCQPRQRERLEFFLSDGGPGEATFYDLVLVIDVIEHVEDIYGFLRSIKSRGTRKIFHIPLDMSVQKVLRRDPIMHLRDQVGHIHYFMKSTALALLTECGYEIDDVFYTAGDLHLRPQSSLAKMAMIPRRLGFALNEDWAAHLLGGFSLMVLAR